LIYLVIYLARPHRQIIPPERPRVRRINPCRSPSGYR